MAESSRIPVSVVTGFLGSGKTTLIGRALREPGFDRCAVIVNEFGEIGLDHELIVAGDGTDVVLLDNGCLCCAARGALAAALFDLAGRRAAGTIPAFGRVLVETSGLADPGPVLQALTGDAALTGDYQAGPVITLVDAGRGAALLARHREARRQVALADCLVITKTDAAPLNDALREALRALNNGAPLHEASFGVGAAALLLADSSGDLTGRLAGAIAPGHTEGIETITLLRDRPLPALALTLWLEALAEQCGGQKLLRMKGLVALEEIPDRPALIQGVGDVVAAPTWLDGWPSADRRSRIVLITERVPRYLPQRLLEAIEAEVREEQERS